MISPTTIAALHERDRLRLESIGVRAMAFASRMASAAAVNAWRRGDDPVAAVSAMVRRAAPTIAESMVAAHLAAMARTTRVFNENARGKGLATAFDDAVAVQQGFLDASDKDVQRLRKRYGKHATSVAVGASKATEKRLRAVVRDLVARGVTTEEGARRLGSAMKRLGFASNKPWLAETIFRTQVQLAYSAGRLMRLNDPDVEELLWGFRYVTVGDDRVRPTHAALDGVTAPKDDPIWRRIMPPNGYNCRCTVIELYAPERRKMPAATKKVRMADGSTQTVKPGPDPGWSFNPISLVKDLDVEVAP